MGSYLKTYRHGQKLYYAGIHGNDVNLQPKEQAIHYLHDFTAEDVAKELAIYYGRHDFQVEAA